MIQEYRLKDGTKRYLIKCYMGLDSLTGKRITTTRRGFRTQKEASLAEARLKLEYEEKTFNAKNSKYTFQQIYELFLVEHKNTVKPGTYATTRRYAKLHILPKIANKRIDSFTVLDCQKLVNQWAEYFNSAKYPKGITQQVFDYAIKMNIITDNPMRKVKLPKRKETINEVNKFYNTDELKHFFDCVKDYGNMKYLAFFRLLAFTGMRKGEALALNWSDIDFNKKQVHITKGVVLDENEIPIISTTKTKKSVRTVSLDDESLAILRKWKLEQAKELMSIGINSLNKHQLLFTYDANKLYRPSYSNCWLEQIIKKYNLKKITMHGFRHSHCSLLFEMGTPIQVVQDRLGHTNIKTTMDIYTHVTEKQRDDIAENFAKHIGF
ncbi:tyrosine-type recombinase/integrase [uncultured Granulicatella sp.]|uniref:tyrosine-type recombinase/integrase n=1 Tax=uncultured Granulicatella sp. TaxID=316089 RepID=UPI0028D36E87|nr:tyrosine-type recombinase/integrase [uncultured Granulicatella sp.]